MPSNELLRVIQGIEKLNPQWRVKVGDWFQSPRSSRPGTTRSNYNKVISYYSPDGIHVVIRETIQSNLWAWNVNIDIKQIYENGEPEVIIHSQELGEHVGIGDYEPDTRDYEFMINYIARIAAEKVSEADRQRLGRKENEQAVKDKFFN
jgi:hypothetical protein